MPLVSFSGPVVALAGLLIALGLVAGYAGGNATERPASGNKVFPMNCSFTAIPPESRQMVIATGNSAGATSVSVLLLSKGDRGWSVSFPPIPATIGRNGFAEPGAKREGDGKTPSGTYPLVFAFGYAKAIASGMPYRQATEQDVWVDDPAARDYNQWAGRSETEASSFEEMRRRDGLYKYGLVIGYNMHPVVQGLGSAIFAHVWKGTGVPTSGCLAMAEKDILRILQWLDPEQNPLIVLGTENTVSTLVK
jgi:L,D-peptidoglycan transpeptidase YkuD (ErfK/YbiS/YcfS/YnhG family)